MCHVNMKKIMHFLVFLTAIISFKIVFSDELYDTLSEVPKVETLSVVDSTSWYLQWGEVDTVDSEQTLGYKIRVWLLKDERVPISRPDSQVAKYVYKPQQIGERPLSESQTYYVKGKNNTSFVYRNATQQILYQIGLQAFSKSWDGPISNILGIRLMK